MADKNLNPMNQKVYNVSDMDNEANYNQQNIVKEQDNLLSPMAETWGKHYQTTQDPTKMSKFQTEMDAPINETIQNLANTASGAFGQSETGMSQEDFGKLLYHTGFHESGAISGQPQMSQGYYDNSGQWQTQGPAGSYFQVEPSTLRDLVTATQPQVGDNPAVTNPTTAYWGPKAAELSGFTADQLYGMTDEQLSGLLQNPEHQMLGAVAAGGKYAKSLNRPVNDTMDAYNKVEQAFN